MPAAARALLFALCALAAPAYLQASDPCNTTNAGGTTKFRLAVTPESYTKNTNYTVTVSGVNGTDTFSAVQLQAFDTSTNKSVGEWIMESTAHSCPDKNLLYNTSSHSYTAHWTSPNTDSASVDIRAYTSDAGTLSLVTRSLKHVPSETPHPTESPKVTGSAKPPATDDSHTSHTTKKPSHGSELTTSMHPSTTTKGGSNSGTYSSWFLIAIVQSVYLMFISGRQ